MLRSTDRFGRSRLAPSGSERTREPRIEPDPDFHVVLVAPEIPPNTGTTARLCAATTTRLHLVGPLGFSLEDRYLRRAGLDYWPHVDLEVHDNWRQFRERHGDASLRLFSAKAAKSYSDVAYQRGDFLVFGGETRGLPAEVVAEHAERCYLIPMSGTAVRSLNLANAAAIVLYEGLRQLGRTARNPPN